tara:strand:- start:712 stop:888 length:177 start_codon:yes stop_codon:yes gene_type:complete
MTGMNMRENGINYQTRNMARGIKFGMTEAYTRDFGKMIRQMVEEDLYMLMAIFTMAIG